MLLSRLVSARSLGRVGARSLATVRVGDAMPDVDVYVSWPPKAVNMRTRCAGRKVVVVGLPGAFTPT